VQRGLARSQHSWRKHAERAAVERRVATLTSPERDVLQLVVTGMLNKQIAAKLGIAEKTVKIHRSHMTHKMEAGSVAELVAMARKLEPPGIEAMREGVRVLGPRPYSRSRPSSPGCDNRVGPR
jgi:FixJ family two-component response regulator